MIESIDQRSVCGHFKAALSGRIPNDTIQAAVGKMINLDPNAYEQVAKELATVFTRALLGRFYIPQEEIPHLAVSNQITAYTDRYGNQVYGNKYKDEWLDQCLHLPPSPTTFQIWAGMTNLKSACVIKTLSRSEKDAQYRAFRHTVDIDDDFASEWRYFVDLFTPVLIEQLELDQEREYDPLWSTPSSSSKHSVTLNDKGELITCLRGSREYADPRLQLRHPAINRLARRHPKEFAEAFYFGYTVSGDVIIDLPEPFDHEPPIGRCGLAPKRAQKPRTVWIPLAIADSLSRPVFHKLKEIELRWNIQGVKSHDDSRRRIRRKLARNVNLRQPQTFCSYDQSAFTDNFSYDIIQRPILESLHQGGIILEYDLDVVDMINHGNWDLKALGRKYEQVPFGTGTGMGTPPSFALASVANGYLVAYSYWKAYGRLPSFQRGKEPGLVVGDDCCIFDKGTGFQYEKVCSTIGLSINESKSFKSQDTAEFCGKLITPEGVWDKHKLIDFPTLSGMTDLIKYYGDKSDLFFAEFSDVLGIQVLDSVHRIQEVPEPYGAKEFQYHEKPFSELSMVDQMATTLQEVARLESLVPDDLTSRRRDFKAIIDRKAMCPEIRCTDTDPAYQQDHPPMLQLDEYRKAIVHNILLEYHRAQSQSLENLYKLSEQVNEVYTALINNDSKLFEKFAQSLPTIVPGRRRGAQLTATQKLAELVKRETPQPNEGGDDYELQ